MNAPGARIDLSQCRPMRILADFASDQHESQAVRSPVQGRAVCDRSRLARLAFRAGFLGMKGSSMGR